MKDESHLSASALLAELSEKLDRVASTSAQASLHTARAVRILDANQQLGVRDRMALVDVVETQRRLTLRLEAVVSKLAPRPASLTVVADADERSDDWSLVNIQLPGAKKMIGIPNRVLWGMIAGGVGTVAGWVFHWLVAR